MVLDLFQLNGKNALVTGSRKGLGAAMALALAQAGANVYCHGQTVASAKEVETCKAIGGLGRRTGYLGGDVGMPEFCDRLIEATVEELGAIDILINNAGTIRRAAAAEYAWEDWQAVLRANLDSVFRLSQGAARRMLLRGQGGKIVNIASLLSFQGGVRVPAYAAAKGGVAQLTMALANEWAGQGINVNAIAPGYMATDNTQALRDDPERSRQILERIPAGRWGRPEDLGGAAVFLCSAASGYLHGHVMVVDGGWLGR